MNHKGTETIKTDRLILRRFKYEDYEEVYENIGCDKNVHKYIPSIPWNNPEKSREFIKLNIQLYSDNLKHYFWAIIYENKIVGAISLLNVEDNDSAELGYCLGSQWWDNGIISEAARAVLSYAFKIVGFHRIYATCHVDNLASKGVLKKVGMSYEGRLRDGQKNPDDSYSDLDLYSILENEFR